MAKSAKAGDRKRAVDPGDPPVHEIRRFHELGRWVLDRAAEDLSSVAVAARAVGAFEGVSVDRARKAALFAARFPERSLGWLCGLHFPDGTLLSVNHVRRVLKVKDLGEWRVWFERAAKAGWSADRLDREIRQAAAAGPGLGGPRIKEPGDLLEALGQVSEWTSAWLKRYDAVWSRETTWPPKIGLSDADPATLRARLRESRRGLELLRKGAEVLEVTIKAIRVRAESRTKVGKG